MRSIAAVLTAAVFVFSAAFCVAADGKTDAGAKVEQPPVPEGPIDIKGSKKTVVFSHQKGHEKIECIVCHHEVDGKQTYAKCTDSGCHDNLTEKKGVSALYYVVHSKSAELKHQSCMSCHVKEAEAKPDLKKQLTGCSGSWCHPQAKKSDKPADEQGGEKPAEEAKG